jgi:hypothetical protein
MNERTLIQPDTEFISYLKKNGGDTLKECYQCATCSVVCSLSPQDQAFPRKEMIAQVGDKKKIYFLILIFGYAMVVLTAVHIAREVQNQVMFLEPFALMPLNILLFQNFLALLSNSRSILYHYL